MTTSATTTPRIDSTIAVWAADIHEEVRRLALNKFYFDVMDADDVASQVVEGFLANAETYVITYRSATIYARAVFSNAAHNWQRSERVQRCQGAELKSYEDGSQGPAREMFSLDAPITDGARPHFVDVLLADGDVESIVVDRGGLQMAIDEAFDRLADSDRMLLEAVYIDGRKRDDIAHELGCADAALRQRLSRARRLFRAAYEVAVERHLAVVPSLAG